MSQNYQAYGGNPYGQSEGGNGQANPYGGGGYSSSNPYGGGVSSSNCARGAAGTDATTQYDQPANPPAAPLAHGDSNYSQQSQYSQGGAQTVPHTDVPLAAIHGNNAGSAYGAAPAEQHGARPLSQEDFLARITGAKTRIGQLTSDIQSISNIHQRMLSSPDNRSSTELEGIVSQTQIRNTQIKDEIKFLEKDAARDPNNSLKRSQVNNLKSTFKKQLEDFQREEADYSKRYREAIGRQYRIINPEATEAEVQEASNSDWGDEGIFTQAVSLMCPQPHARISSSNCTNTLDSSRATAADKHPACSVLFVRVTMTSSALRRPCLSLLCSSSSSTSRSSTKRHRWCRPRSRRLKSRATQKRPMSNWTLASSLLGAHAS